MPPTLAHRTFLKHHELCSDFKGSPLPSTKSLPTQQRTYICYYPHSEDIHTLSLPLVTASFPGKTSTILQVGGYLFQCQTSAKNSGTIHCPRKGEDGAASVTSLSIEYSSITATFRSARQHHATSGADDLYTLTQRMERLECPGLSFDFHLQLCE